MGLNRFEASSSVDSAACSVEQQRSATAMQQIDVDAVLHLAPPGRLLLVVLNSAVPVFIHLLGGGDFCRPH